MCTNQDLCGSRAILFPPVFLPAALSSNVLRQEGFWGRRPTWSDIGSTVIGKYLVALKPSKPPFHITFLLFLLTHMCLNLSFILSYQTDRKSLKLGIISVDWVSYSTDLLLNFEPRGRHDECLENTAKENSRQ